MSLPEDLGIEHGSIEHLSGGNGAEAFFERSAFLETELNLAAMYMEEEELEDLGNKIVEELDAICPYYLKLVVMSGKAVLPKPSEIEQDDDEDRPVASVEVLESNDEEGFIYAKVDDISGVHNGTTLNQIIDGTEEGQAGWRIRHEVCIGQYSYSKAQGTRRGQEHVFAYFDLDSEILLAEDIDADLVRNNGSEGINDSEESVDIIKSYSASVVDLLRSKKFKSMPRSGQLALLEKRIKDTEARAPIRDREIALVFQSLRRQPRKKLADETRHYVYIPQIHGDNIQYKKRAIVGDSIGGVCRGLVSIEMANLHKKPIRKNKDAVDSRAGLCLAVMPDNITSIRAGADDLIYVPISSQKFDALFD